MKILAKCLVSLVLIAHCMLGLLLITLPPTANASCYGCVELDSLTFEKLINRFRYTIVKFDIAFPYGAKHEAYADFAKTVAPKLPAYELLVALVGVKDYGEKENSELAERYSVDEKNFPEILLFRNTSLENYTKFDRSQTINVENLKEFMRENSDLYIGLDGCLREFDNFAGEFTITTNEKDRQEILQNAKDFLENELKDEFKNLGSIYIRTMERILERGEQFIIDEQQRLENLLKGKLSENKRLEIVYRSNILKTFNDQKTINKGNKFKAEL